VASWGKTWEPEEKSRRSSDRAKAVDIDFADLPPSGEVWEG
jgi:hypothetical protein